MNGYSLDSYKKFAQNWKLVTVRYRIDSGEFRFIYANSIAWTALSHHRVPYPDGSIFAKTSYRLSQDSSFPSSLLPSEVDRYQLMIRNSKKHATTGGWGYALFDKKGRTFSGNPHSVSLACNACHQIVAEKGGIFAVPVQTDISFFADERIAKPQKIKWNPGILKFEKISAATLPERLTSRLPPHTKVVQSIVGPLKQHLFQGTLSEIRPFLALKAFQSKMPAILISTDQTQFSALFIDVNSKSGCETQTNKGVSMVVVNTVQHPKLFMDVTSHAPLPKVDLGIAVRTSCFAVN